MHRWRLGWLAGGRADFRLSPELCQAALATTRGQQVILWCSLRRLLFFSHYKRSICLVEDIWPWLLFSGFPVPGRMGSILLITSCSAPPDSGTTEAQGGMERPAGGPWASGRPSGACLLLLPGTFLTLPGASHPQALTLDSGSSVPAGPGAMNRGTGPAPGWCG